MVSVTMSLRVKITPSTEWFALIVVGVFPKGLAAFLKISNDCFFERSASIYSRNSYQINSPHSFARYLIFLSGMFFPCEDPWGVASKYLSDEQMHVNDSDTCPNNNVAFLSTLQNHLRVLQQPQLNFLNLQGFCICKIKDRLHWHLWS